MNQHLCKKITPGCYRCELNKDEIEHIRQENLEEAEQAWEKYRDDFLAIPGNKKTQMRRREFIAGFMAGRES